MDIRFHGTESQGVRGLSCEVRLENRCVLIDPGVALGFRRAGAPPHPVEVAAAEGTKKRLMDALQESTDVVISHFHGDHMPLVQTDPYQFSAVQAMPLLAQTNLWVKSTEGESRNSRRRARELTSLLGHTLPIADGRDAGWLAFSHAVPHGEQRAKTTHVIMTKIQEAGSIFVHASDIQLLDDQAVEQILTFEPETVLVSGPPLYMGITSEQLDQAYERAVYLAQRVGTLIIDHHILRDWGGIEWFERLQRTAGENDVMCTADYMNRPRRFLEAQRRELYKQYPVSNTWHTAYAQGEETTADYRGLE